MLNLKHNKLARCVIVFLIMLLCFAAFAHIDAGYFGDFSEKLAIIGYEGTTYQSGALVFSILFFAIGERTLGSVLAVIYLLLLTL